MENCNSHEPRGTAWVPLCRSIAALGMAFSVALPYATYAQGVTPPIVPDNLKVPSGNVAFLVGHATGSQNYECQPADSLGRVAWTLFTPEATLFDDGGNQIITHFFSPNPAENNVVIRATWQDSQDTSIVWAKAVASVADPTGGGAIPWVTLQAVGTQTGPTGGGTLASTTFVQRVNTVGGAAPATGCDNPPDIGHKAFIPYTADYFFYKKQ
jgi:hypothetical protein